MATTKKTTKKTPRIRAIELKFKKAMGIKPGDVRIRIKPTKAMLKARMRKTLGTRVRKSK